MQTVHICVLILLILKEKPRVWFTQSATLPCPTSQIIQSSQSASAAEVAELRRCHVHFSHDMTCLLAVSRLYLMIEGSWLVPAVPRTRDQG